MPTREQIIAAAELELRRRGVSSGEWWLPNPDPSVPPHRLDRNGLVKGRARPNQRPPDGDWFSWVLRMGRGAGKTRSGSEWIDKVAREGQRGDQILIAGRTPADVNTYALKGQGGLLRWHPDVKYFPTNRIVRWPNGVEAIIRSGANPEEFRGFSGSKAWLDEFAAWDAPRECWENLILGLRERDPRVLITTTPRPIPILKEILASSSTVVAAGSSYDNADNLDPRWAQDVLSRLEGTRLGRQEISAEILEDVEGALWTLAIINVIDKSEVPDLVRIVVGVDPQGSKVEHAMTGIVVVGLGTNGHLYVLADGSINGTPAEWGQQAINLYTQYRCDRIVGERNYGGEMVEHVIRSVNPNVPFSLVTATRGKIRRAEPIASIYEQHKAHHASAFPHLVEEMTTFTPTSKFSPNRLDGLTWAATELIGETEIRKVYGTWGRRKSMPSSDATSVPVSIGATWGRRFRV